MEIETRLVCLGSLYFQTSTVNRSVATSQHIFLNFIGHLCELFFVPRELVWEHVEAVLPNEGLSCRVIDSKDGRTLDDKNRTSLIEMCSSLIILRKEILSLRGIFAYFIRPLLSPPLI